MRKLIIAVMIICFGLTAGLSTVAISGTECKPKFIIETKGLKKDLKPGVGFTHKLHARKYGIECTECHHVFKDGKNVFKEGDNVQKCAECHTYKKAKGTPKKQYKLKKAMHKNCQDCHKKLAKKKKPTGPTKKCAECHTGALPTK